MFKIKHSTVVQYKCILIWQLCGEKWQHKNTESLGFPIRNHYTSVTIENFVKTYKSWSWAEVFPTILFWVALYNDACSAKQEGPVLRTSELTEFQTQIPSDLLLFGFLVSFWFVGIQRPFTAVNFFMSPSSFLWSYMELQSTA